MSVVPEQAELAEAALPDCANLEQAGATEVSSRDRTAWHAAGGWQALWFLLHLAAVYAIVNLITPSLSAWTRETLLPLIGERSTSGRFEFLYSHILALTFIPGFAAGLGNGRFKHNAAGFVWIVPTAILAYQFLTFPPASILQSQFSAACHQYFGSGFVIPEFRDWGEFWASAKSSPDMLRGKAQLDITAPFYAGVAYSLAAFIAHRTDLARRVAEKLTKWEDSRFPPRA